MGMRRRFRMTPNMSLHWARKWRDFYARWEDESGVAAMEFAFIAMIAVTLFSGIVQFGFVLFIDNHMADVARDAARRFAVGESNQSETVQYAQDTLLNWGVTYTVTVTPNVNDVDVQVSLPMSSVAIIDMLRLFQSGTLSASVTMLTE